MKNMSFGKMVALFGGFLLLMIVAAFVIIKMSAGGGAKPQVTTKRYKPQEATQAAARPEAPAPATPATLATAATAATVQPAQQSQPALLLPAGGSALQAQGAVVAAAPPASVDLHQNQNLANVNAAVLNLDSRVALLESKRGMAGANGTHAVADGGAPKVAPRRVRKPVRVVVLQQPKPLTEMRGYKALAVVGGRAWVSAPDGAEDSVVSGEVLPRARVRSVSKDTGTVITTTDERIDAVR